MKKIKINTTLNSLNWLYEYIKPYRIWLIYGILACLILVVFNILKTYFIKEIIDTALNNQNQHLVYIIIIITVIFYLSILASYFQKYASGKLGTLVLKDIRNKLMQYFGKLSFASLDKIHSADITSRLNNEIWSIRNFIQDQLNDFIFQPIMFSCSFIFMIIINWKLAISSFILIPFVIYLTTIITKKTDLYWKNYYSNLGTSNTIIQDTIKGINIVKTFNLENHLYNKFKVYLHSALEYGLKIEKRNSSILPLVIIMYELPFVICVLYGGYLSVNKEIQPANLIAFIQLLSFVVQPLVKFPQMITNIRSLVGAITRLSEVETLQTERTDGKKNTLDTSDSIIEFNNVSFGYTDKKDVIREVSFSIKSGQKVGLVGVSGSGKSTIFDLISGFYEPNKGSISIFGESIENWNLDSLRKNISYVSQSSFIYPESVMENIRYGKLGASNEDVYFAAKQANADELILRLPNGYNTIIGEGGIKLSGGERQRIAIARALIKDSQILLLDEPTSALDNISESNIIQLLNSLTPQKTIIVIAHRLWSIKDFDNILVLKDGHIIESGNHNQLMDICGTYYNLYISSCKKVSNY